MLNQFLLTYSHFCDLFALVAPWNMFVLLGGLPLLFFRYFKRRGIDD